MSGIAGASGRQFDGATFPREEKLRKTLQIYISQPCHACEHMPSLREVAKLIGVKYDTLYRFTIGAQNTMHPQTIEKVEGWLRKKTVKGKS